MEYFVKKDSIVRKIWGNADTLLFIFAGASAEFALNKAVDWLYFTGKLPADPLGRLFSTIGYARQIVFSEKEAANRAIDTITLIHKQVESNRGSTIPDWAYRDVLYMLIHYSIKCFEVLQRKLTAVELDEVYDVFKRLGTRMDLKELPETYNDWLTKRDEHLQNDMVNTDCTIDLYRQYKKHLGWLRFQLLLQAQIIVVPERVNHLLKIGTFSWLRMIIPVYKFLRLIKLDKAVKAIILPDKYKKQISALDVTS
ncbi:hypothetical protein BH09BAC2_BH09BAC2_18960 [soil metagenome]